MNEQEDRLQAHLEQLESGESLEHLMATLPPEETELLHLAVSLRTMEMPARDATQVKRQRAALMSMAQEKNGAADMKAISFWQIVRDWLRGHPGLLVAGSAIAILLLLFLIEQPKPETAESTKSTPAAAIAVESRETDAELITTVPTAAASVTLTPASAGATSPAVADQLLYLPAVGHHIAGAPDKVQLRDATGLVEIQAADGTWTLATSGNILNAGQHIRTGDLSSAVLVFYDGSQAAVGPDSEIRLDTVDAQRPENGFRKVVLSQVYGNSTHQVQFRNDTGSRYEVRGPAGSGLARGTKFRVTVGADGTTDYTVTEGRVDVSNMNRTVPVIAGQTTAFATDEPPADPIFIVMGEGIVSQIGSVWIVAGQSFAVDANTQIAGDPQVGDLVSVEAHLQPNGPPLAVQIGLLRPAPANRFQLTGLVDNINPDAWIIAGQIISITVDTDIDAGIIIGDRVRAVGVILPNGGLQADQIEPLDNDDTHPFEFIGVVQTILSDTWTISGVDITVNAATEITGGIDVGDLVQVEGQIMADGTWLADEIKLVALRGATFTFTGLVESIAPWQVAGVAFDVEPWTMIDPGIVAGDLVRVSGRILADGTWVAYEIEKLDDDNTLLKIVFVGTVDAMGPWVVSGLPIVTDAATIIDPDVAVGDLVRVTALIRFDNTWLATRIEKLDVSIDPGCVAFTAVITAINGNQIFLGDGQTIILGPDIIVDGELKVGSVVLIIACANQDGSITIISITIIYDPAPPPPPPGPTPPPAGDGDKVTICHKPGTPAEMTKSVPQSALSGHLGHGDTLGTCP